MSFDRTSTWISRNRNAMLIYVCDRKSRGKNLNNQFLLFPFENEKFHMQNSVSSISCCRSWGELVENLGGASSTMCIQLIRNKLRRFHTQAASGSRLANFPSSITNFAQNLARMCQGLFYMHFLWVVWAPSIVPSIPMHGRLSKGQSQPLTPAPPHQQPCALFDEMQKCRKSQRWKVVAAATLWLPASFITVSRSSALFWMGCGMLWVVDVLRPDKTKCQQLRLSLTWIYMEGICQGFFSALQSCANYAHLAKSLQVLVSGFPKLFFELQRPRIKLSAAN